MNNLFDHINIQQVVENLEHLAQHRFGIAHHADADGCISAAFTVAAYMISEPKVSFVQTDDLCLSNLAEWVKAEKIANLVTLDINVFSSEGAIAKLAKEVTGTVMVIDDHLGDDHNIPSNVSMLNLLPPGPRVGRKDQIRPTFLFCDKILEKTRGHRTGAQDFLKLAGLYGEGVRHLFPIDLPGIQKKSEKLARSFGRGLTAYYLTHKQDSTNAEMVTMLVNLLLGSSEQETVNEAAKRIDQGEITNKLRYSSSKLETEVERCAKAANTDKPWVSSTSFEAYFIPVESDYRIVNLVASQVRTNINRGITIAIQETAKGDAIELRRARSMNAPNLVDYLTELDSRYFISRGGHPMACGATIVPGYTEKVLGELRSKLSVENGN